MNHIYKKPSKYVDYNKINKKDFFVKNIKNVKDRDNLNLLHFVYEKDNINFKLTVHYQSNKIIKINLKNIYAWKKENFNVSNKIYYQLKYFCYNEIYKYITIRKDHYFYKGLNYNITNLYRNYKINEFKYQILQLRNKTKHFVFYWKYICKNWDNEFLKDNLWSRQIIIDFLCRFNKLKMLGKKKKWILEETEYFYLKGFNFKVVDQNLDKCLLINNIYFIRKGRIGSYNKTEELVKFFNGEECVINFYTSDPLNFNNKTILYIKNIEIFKWYFADSIVDETKNSLKILNINIKQIYQMIVNDNKLNLNNKFILQMVKFINKNINNKQIKYPKYLKTKIKLESQKMLINNF